MSLLTPRLVTRTTTKKAVVFLVTTVVEVFEVDAEHVDELPPSARSLRKAEPVLTVPARRLAGVR